MTLRWRLVLALVGLTLFCVAVTSLVYRWWPLPATREDFQPPPTLFAPPEASMPGIEAA